MPTLYANSSPSAHARSLLARRDRAFGGNTPVMYSDPVHLVRGEDVWLYDHEGTRYLDCYNNVAVVGHCNPRVVEAVNRQTSTLNVHSRYLHETVLDYADRLLETFADDELSTLLLTCTASEANDVALRMARMATGRRGFLVSDFNYHGNTSTVMELSTMLDRQDTATGHVRSFPVPDTNWPHRGEKTPEDVAARVLDHVDAAIESLKRSGHGVAGVLLCPGLLNEGFPVLPADFLSNLVRRVRRAGGVVIADEVQSGFGRLGQMWGHELVDIEADIVTMGKPMGNGYPVAGLVTSRDLMDRFRSQNFYFNTYGSNPVAATAALATLDVIEEDNLADNAATVGAYLTDGLTRLAERHHQIGQVRGHGLFVGCEIIARTDKRDRVTGKKRRPDSALAKRLVDSMRNNGVLVGLIGVNDNLLKVRPPLTFTTDHADQFLMALDMALRTSGRASTR